MDKLTKGRIRSRWYAFARRLKAQGGSTEITYDELFRWVEENQLEKMLTTNGAFNGIVLIEPAKGYVLSNMQYQAGHKQRVLTTPQKPRKPDKPAGSLSVEEWITELRTAQSQSGNK